MADLSIDDLRLAIYNRWITPFNSNSEKITRYVGQFFNMTRLRSRISGQVKGNHGTYTVTISITDHVLMSSCSCYIGKQGNCHHCAALALTFLKDANMFEEVKTRTRDELQKLDTLKEYLDGVTLDSLIQELKASGITQKAFAESIGMSPRQLSIIQSSERRNHIHNELGATKLACLWVIEHFEHGTFRKTHGKGIGNNGKTKQV